MRHLLLMTTLLVLGSCTTRDNPPRTPSILLISLDTLRADRLGCYGYESAASPQLDAFAAQATLYARAKAAAPWTLPSHATMFTGLHPFEHGAHSYAVDLADTSETLDNVLPLDPAYQTLAERLQESGYRTGGIAANEAYLGDEYGCTQGFEHYEVLPETGDAVVANAQRWLEASDERPFFLFLNFMDTHSPYNTSPREGWRNWGTPEQSAELVNRLNDVLLSGEAALPENLFILSKQYDLAIANLDEILGGFFAWLRSRELWDELLIVVTSDHGEYLGEHRLIGHSKDVYEQAMAIPLMIKAPAQRIGEVESRPIGLVHLVDRLAVHVDALEAMRRHTWPTSPVTAENHFTRLRDLRRPWGSMFLRSRAVIYDGDRKLIHSTDGADEFYDLATDPHELAPLRLDPAAEALRRTLLEQLQPRFADLASVAAERPGAMRRLSAEEIERLRSLGYF